MKKKKIIYILIIVVILVIALAITAITMAHRMMRPALTYSYIASVHTFIGGQECQEVNEIGAGLKPDWSFFTQEQYALLQKCLEHHITDLDRKNTKDGRSKVLLDDWGERIIIAGRRKGLVICDFIIWSKGPDRILGTSDDISSLWGEPIPPNLQQN